jgi:hypothetical protein
MNLPHENNKSKRLSAYRVYILNKSGLFPLTILFSECFLFIN